MFLFETAPASDPLKQTLRQYYRLDEQRLVELLLPLAELPAASAIEVKQRASRWVLAIRLHQYSAHGVDALLKEFSLSTDEGIVLMCLAEALLRVPDKATVDSLIRDKLSGGDWQTHLGHSNSLFVNASAWGLLLTGKWVDLQDATQTTGLLKQAISRLGEPVIRASMRLAMQVMGDQFVMGKTIEFALKRAANGVICSYDMLGEGARTGADAQRYFDRYQHAIEMIGQASQCLDVTQRSGISVKLSALHPRYQYSQRQRLIDELVPRLKQLALGAKRWNIGFTIDAEEARVLDLSLEVIETIFSDSDFDGWSGFGLAVQAYQKRALFLLRWLKSLSRRLGKKINVRLVKGAYWDSEIKWSQMDGFSHYPVFTRKVNTDISYVACARELLANRDVFYPQFATHNAYTVATVLALDNATSESDGVRAGYQFQRLHGMGEALYKQVLVEENIPCCIYAPVGEHGELLAYLVRRLLENGANTSFVNNILDETVPVEKLLLDPVAQASYFDNMANPAIPLPCELYCSSRKENGKRLNSQGFDLSDPLGLERLDKELNLSWVDLSARIFNRKNAVTIKNPANRQQLIGGYQATQQDQIKRRIAGLSAAALSWGSRPVAQRAELLRGFSEVLQQHRAELILLCVKEAGKTVADSIDEVREAIDFCRYYADQGEALMATHSFSALGVVLCISPWNFPLAIFVGQLSAALVVGNTVLAKPAEQTSLVAKKVIELMRHCDFPEGIVELALGPGQAIGELLLPDARIAAVMFTGSTQTGKWLAQALAKRVPYTTNTPLIAETGGQNAMIVDTTALPEQVLDDILTSGFKSAGQRCSSLRVLFLQEEIADTIIDMVMGAMSELVIGDPALLATDVGPVIDPQALRRLQTHKGYLSQLANTDAKILQQCELPRACAHGNFFAPMLVQLSSLTLLYQEVFGPIVHVIRYQACALDDVVRQINATGFGLTLGIHTRIQTSWQRIVKLANVGNIYVNRNMVGAVVGVQPFGGRGLSGTGPKAGGPNYLSRLVAPVIASDTKASVQLPLAKPQASYTALVLSRHRLDESPVERILILRSFASNLVEANLMTGNLPDKLAVLLQHAGEYFIHPTDLPGPTGETNQLVYQGRVALLLLLEAECFIEELAVQLVAGLLSGARIVLAVAPQCLPTIDKWLAGLAGLGLPDEFICIKPFADTADIAFEPLVQAVVVSSQSSYIAELRQLVGQRPGPLIPVISEFDPQQLLMRLVLEKTITVNTTAAGGNASLMSL